GSIVTTIWAVAALLAPWLAGMALVAASCRGRATMAWILGGGWFAGQAWVMFAVYATLVVLGQGYARGVLVVAILLPGLGLLLLNRYGPHADRGEAGVLDAKRDSAIAPAGWTVPRVLVL